MSLDSQSNEGDSWPWVARPTSIVCLHVLVLESHVLNSSGPRTDPGGYILPNPTRLNQKQGTGDKDRNDYLHASTKSNKVSSPPTFPGKTTNGTPRCLQVCSSQRQSGTPGAAWPTTRARLIPSPFVAVSDEVIPPYPGHTLAIHIQSVEYMCMCMGRER